jgi:hypothetical protein
VPPSMPSSSNSAAIDILILVCLQVANLPSSATVFATVISEEQECADVKRNVLKPPQVHARYTAIYSSN